MFDKKHLHVEDDNVAIPEIRSEEYDELQKKADEEENRERNEKGIFYDNVAVPEIHLRRKKKS